MNAHSLPLTAGGRSISAAVRDALVREAQREADERLRAEALVLAADPRTWQRHARVLADLEPLRGW